MLESPSMLCSSLFMMDEPSNQLLNLAKPPSIRAPGALLSSIRVATSLNWTLPMPHYAPLPQFTPHCSQVDFLKQT